jgi:hypothetical protein
LAIGESADAPTAYARALVPRAERLGQRYARLADDGERSCDDHAATIQESRSASPDARHSLIAAPDSPNIRRSLEPREPLPHCKSNAPTTTHAEALPSLQADDPETAPEVAGEHETMLVFDVDAPDQRDAEAVAR